MKKLSALMLLSATMILASCGKPAEKPAESKADEPTSQAQEESKAESQPAASTAESKPAASSAPATSTPAPASSSKPAGTSTPAPASSSKPAGTSTPAPVSTPTSVVDSTPEAPTSTVTIAAAGFVTEADVNYFKVTGTITGLTGDAAKFAFGLKHKSDTEGGAAADALDGQWLIGSEAPAAADYKHAPTIAADGTFEIKISLADVTWVKGSYEMHVGPQGHYAKIDLQQSEYTGGGFKANGCKMIVRGDRDLIYAEELPPITLSSSVVLVEEGKAILKVGGELGGVTAAEFEAMTIKVTAERQVGGWSKTALDASKVTNVVDGNNGYIKIDVTDLGVGGYQIKIGFDGTSAPDTTMECESFDNRDNAVPLGFKKFASYYSAGSGDAEHLYGCCGLFIESNPKELKTATTKIEAEDMILSSATTAAKEESDTVTSGTGYVKELTKSGSGWGATTQAIEAPINLPEAGKCSIKVAYKTAEEPTAAFELRIDGQSKGNKGAAAAEWTVYESELLDFTAGDHTITVRGLSNTKTDIDYIEIVKHDHIASMTWGDAVAATEELCAYTPGTCSCTGTAIKMAAGADLNGKLTNDGKLPRNSTTNSYDGTVLASFKFNAAAEGTVSFLIEAAFDADGNGARSFYDGKEGGQNAFPLSDGKTNTVMKINGTEITLPTATYTTLLGGITAKNTFGTMKIADLQVTAGVNEITMTATSSYGLKFRALYILF